MTTTEVLTDVPNDAQQIKPRVTLDRRNAHEVTTLQAAIVHVKAAVGTRRSGGPFDLFSAVAVELKRNNTLTLQATDLDLRLTATLPFAGTPFGPVLVNFKTFVGAAKVKKGGHVQLAVNDDHLVVTVGARQTVLKLIGNDDRSDDLRKFTAEQERPAAGEELTFTADDVKALKVAARFTSDDEARPILTGVAILPDGRAIGTNSYIAGFTQTSARPAEPLLVPRKVINALPDRGTRMLVASSAANRDVKRFYFDGGDARLIAGQFPALDSLIPPTFGHHATTNASDFINALDAFSFSAKSSPTTPIILDGSEITMKSPGLIDVRVAAKFDGFPPYTLAFNPYYAKIVTSALQDMGATELTFATSEPIKLALVTGDVNFTTVLMPVRVP